MGGMNEDQCHKAKGPVPHTPQARACTEPAQNCAGSLLLPSLIFHNSQPISSFLRFPPDIVLQLRLALPHEFLHDFLHPHLQPQEADAVVPPESEEVQQVPVGFLQHEMLPAEDGASAHHFAPLSQPCGDRQPLSSPSRPPGGPEVL